MTGPQITLPRWGVTQWVVLCSLLVALPLLPPSPLPSWALEQAQTPSQIVQHWMTVYPKNLDTAVTLTTATMRNDLTPERWIRHSKALLLNLGLEYLDGQVLSEEVTGNRAVVTLKAYLSTTIGDQVQHERYTLRRINGQWLIDEMKVVAERFLGQVM